MSSKAIIVIAVAITCVLGDSTPSYQPPAPSYNTPEPSYNAPAPSYNAPAPSYNAPAPSYNAPAPSYNEGPAQYDTQYSVKDDYTGNDFGQQESRNGYDTQGTYYVQLPDGRVQKVTYTVTKDSGYVAEVTYEGEAQYPPHQPSQGYQPAPQAGYA